MAFYESSLRLQKSLQNIVPLPWVVTLKNNVIHNSCYNRNFQTICRHITFLYIGSALMISIYRLYWMYAQWKSYAVVNVGEAVIYGMVFCCTSLCFIYWYTITKHSKDIQLMLNQLRQVSARSLESFPWIDYLKFATIYVLEVVCIIVSSSTAFLPFVIPHDIFQLTFGTHLTVKLIVAPIYVWCSFYGGNILLSVVMFMFVAVEGSIASSSKLCVQNLIIPSSRSYLSMTKVNKLFRTLQTTRILTAISNAIIELPLISLINFGELLTTCSVFMTLKMYKYVNTFMYLTGPSFSVVSFAIAIYLTYLGGVPNKNGIRFKRILGYENTNKRGKLLLRTCCPIGMKIGPYGLVTATLGILILDDIIKNTVNLLLINPSY